MTTASPRRKVPTRRLVLGGAAGALLLALGLRSVVSPARPGGDVPPISLDAQAVPGLPPPEPTGSAAEVAEVEELMALQAGRTEAQAQEAAFWQKGAVLRWNEIATGLIAKYNTSPVVASRVLALVSVAQHDALLAARRAARLHKRAAPQRVTPLFAAQAESSYPSEHAVVASVSAAVLSYLYSSKEQVATLAKRSADHQDARMWAGVSRRSDVAAGDQLGREVAQKIIARARTDGASEAGVNWQGTIPTGKGKWASSEHPPVIPLRVKWGAVRPWLMKTGNQFRSPPPPDVDSAEFAAALDEVRQIARSRTDEQVRIARFWGDSPGSATPPGHWNKIAVELIEKQPMSEGRAARIMALLNMAVMDAGISCWETKYTYWFLRPPHADPSITLPVGLPNFPSYTSGHSTFSAAASEVIAHFFPAERERLVAMAEEASISRLYDGIHYRFDGTAGLAAGRAIARLAIEKAEREGTP